MALYPGLLAGAWALVDRCRRLGLVAQVPPVAVRPVSHPGRPCVAIQPQCGSVQPTAHLQAHPQRQRAARSASDTVAISPATCTDHQPGRTPCPGPSALAAGEATAVTDPRSISNPAQAGHRPRHPPRPKHVNDAAREEPTGPSLVESASQATVDTVASAGNQNAQWALTITEMPFRQGWITPRANRLGGRSPSQTPAARFARAGSSHSDRLATTIACPSRPRTVGVAATRRHDPGEDHVHPTPGPEPLPGRS